MNLVLFEFFECTERLPENDMEKVIFETKKGMVLSGIYVDSGFFTASIIGPVKPELVKRWALHPTADILAQGEKAVEYYRDCAALVKSFVEWSGKYSRKNIYNMPFDEKRNRYENFVELENKAKMLISVNEAKQ